MLCSSFRSPLARNISLFSLKPKLINDTSLRYNSFKPIKSKTWKNSRKQKTKHEYHHLRNTKQFPENPKVFEDKLSKIKKKYKKNDKEQAEEFQGVTMDDDLDDRARKLKEFAEKTQELTIEEQESLLKTLLRQGNIQDMKVAESFEGPVKKLLNPEMYEVFKSTYIPYDVSPTKMELADKFFTAKPQLKYLIGKTEDLCKPKKIHQVSFAGRSNVGKSSLLNRLFGMEKNLVRVSSTPGFTKTVNYYELGATTWEPRSIYLIDMPGYGYAKASKTAIKQFQQLVVDFLNYPVTYQHRCFVLIDVRVGIGSLDKELLGHLEYCSITYQIILTKVDKVTTQELKEKLLEIQQYLRSKEVTMGHPWIIATSATSGLGISELKACICMATGILTTD